jgi:hypothetical protein
MIHWQPTKEFWEKRMEDMEAYRYEILDRWENDLRGNIGRLTELSVSLMGVYHNVQQELKK